MPPVPHSLAGVLLKFILLLLFTLPLLASAFGSCVLLAATWLLPAFGSCYSETEA